MVHWTSPAFGLLHLMHFYTAVHSLSNNNLHLHLPLSIYKWGQNKLCVSRTSSAIGTWYLHTQYHTLIKLLNYTYLFKFEKDFFICECVFVSVCVSVCACIHMHADAYRDQKRASTGNGIKVVSHPIWVLGIQVLCKSRKCSQPLSYLYSPGYLFLKLI